MAVLVSLGWKLSPVHPGRVDGRARYKLSHPNNGVGELWAQDKCVSSTEGCVRKNKAEKPGARGMGMAMQAHYTEIRQPRFLLCGVSPMRSKSVLRQAKT